MKWSREGTSVSVSKKTGEPGLHRNMTDEEWTRNIYEEYRTGIEDKNIEEEYVGEEYKNRI
jgi:hypothetical protein